MSALIAAGIGAAGAIGSSMLPSLFSGKGGTSQQQSGTQNSNNISGPVPGSPYEVFQNQQLSKIASAADTPYQYYDTSKMFAPFNQDQQNAFGQVRNAGSSWQPAFGQAQGALDNSNYNPVTAGATAFGNAGSAPGGVSTANPYATTAAQMTPDVISQYLNPYINNTVNASNQLQSSNFLNNVLPGLTNQFVGSGGGLGSKQYGTAVNTGLTNLNQNIGNTSQAALAQAYNASAGQAQNDLARNAGLAGTMGNLALGDINAQTNLGTAQGQNAALGANTGINRATAYQGLGTGYLNNSLIGANALLQVGNQQQQQDQLQKTADYQQFKEAQQYPFQTAGWAAQTANQYQWPMRSNTSGGSSSSGGGSAFSQGSPLSTGLGLASAVGSILPGLRSGDGTIGQQQPGVPGSDISGTGGTYQRGGYLRKARGGHVGGYYANYIGRGFPDLYAGGYLGLNEPSMPPKAQPAFKDTYAEGGYLGIDRTSRAVTAQPAFIAGEPMQDGFVDFDHASMPPKMQPAFANTYATGGRVHNRWSDRGRYPMEGRISFMPRENVPGDPAFGSSGGFAAGGSIPVIKAAKGNTDRSLKASRKEKQMRERMARPDLPIDLSGRSGFFQ